MLDSSVLIAASISHAGVCAALLEDLLEHHELVTSNYILDEVARKLAGKFHFPRDDVRLLVDHLRQASSVVEPAHVPARSCRDAADLPILGTAVAGNCRLLVSVDKDLLDLGMIGAIPIIRPGDYWRIVRQA